MLEWTAISTFVTGNVISMYHIYIVDTENFKRLVAQGMSGKYS